MQKRAMEVDPTNILAYSNLMALYIRMDRFAEAKAVAELPSVKKANVPSIHGTLLAIAYLEGDLATAAKEAHLLEPTPEYGRALLVRERYLLGVGKQREAKALVPSIQALSAQPGASQRGSTALEQLRYGRALAGNCQALKEGGPGRDPLPELHALLVCGDTAGAVVSVEKTQARTDVGLEYASWARATIALAQHNPQQTIVELDPLRRRDSTTIGPGLRGMAYMELKKPAEAVTEFRKLVERRSQLFDPWYPWARLQLARSLAQAGNTAEAKKSYEAFLTLWKDADPGIPLMDQAKKEYAALR